MRRAMDQELSAWKRREKRLPLLLRGARGVGKTYLIETFGKREFKQLCRIDCEGRPDLFPLFSSNSAQEILEHIELALQVKIDRKETLLVLDEVQACPAALLSLRLFREQLPELALIAISSEQGVLSQTIGQFPLSGLEFLYLRPLSFIEFLESAAPSLLEGLSRPTLSLSAHEVLMKWVRTYFFVGGMPKAVEAFLSSQSLLDAQSEHRKILEQYERSCLKRASRLQRQHLSLMLEKIPYSVGEVLKYAQVDPTVRSRSLKATLGLLLDSGLLHQAFASDAEEPPFHQGMRDHRFKLFFLDVGLLQTALRSPVQQLLSHPILKIEEGRLAVQFVAQELLAAASPKQNRPLYFWERESSGEAEIDFLHAVGAYVVGMEVKGGKMGRLRALKSFLQRKKDKVGVRISDQPFSWDETILSLPFYFISRLEGCLQMADVIPQGEDRCLSFKG